MKSENLGMCSLPKLRALNNFGKEHIPSPPPAGEGPGAVS